MIRRSVRWACLVALLLGAPIAAIAQDDDSDVPAFRTVVWRGVPIALSMQVGQEKILSFDEDVQWSIPRELVGLVRGEAIAGNVYLSTDEAFEKARFRFRGMDSNHYYVIDLTASARGETIGINVKEGEPRTQAGAGHSGDSSATSATPAAKPSGIPQLTRFAFQSVYAPERLIEKPADVSESRVSRPEVIEHLVLGHEVLATPLAQWRNDSGDYAIALGLRNLETTAVDLDPRRMRRHDRWLSIAMINDQLAPRGMRGDETTVVIVADGRWSEVSEWLR